MSKLRVGSLFAGIGGICNAFKQAGCDVTWANEFDKHACSTYRLNFPDTQLVEADINELLDSKVNGFEWPETDILTSGFPCQAFSIAGYRQGFNDEKGRGNLFFRTAELIETLQPKAFLLENVKNLVGHDKGNTFKIIEKTITEDLGYSFIPFVLNAKDFGNVPQNRERIYIVGFKGEAKFSNDDDEKLDSVLTHQFQIPEPIALEKTIHDVISKDKQDDRFLYPETHRYYEQLNDEMTSRDTIYQWRRVYVRENKSNVCPTLTANMGTGGHNVPLIRDKFGIRKLTPDECIRFQGFPSSFKFPETMAISHRYKQAGNSVVVPVVERIAKEIVKVLDGGSR